MLMSAIYMPFLGIFSATLANAVPVGGGIVFVPALAIMGSHIKLGASFTVATMTVRVRADARIHLQGVGPPPFVTPVPITGSS